MLDKLLKKEALLIAAGTMALYASVYFFERGFCTRLNIPLDYIQISIPTVANDVMYFYMFIFPLVVMCLAILTVGKRHHFKKWYALSLPCCGLVYGMLLFYFMDKSFLNAGACLMLGGFFFAVLDDVDDYLRKNETGKSLHQRVVSAALAVFIFCTSFVILGNSFAKNASFETYVHEGKSYALLKVYGDNVFMQEIVNGKRVRDLTYFNTQNMTGMTLKAEKDKW